MGNTNTCEIAEFLARVKKLLASDKYILIPRQKNLQSLAEHGFTIDDAKEEIYNLTANDYRKGPIPDRDTNYPGEIWEFKKRIDFSRFYIKIKISKENGEEVLKCLSFHENESN